MLTEHFALGECISVYLLILSFAQFFFGHNNIPCWPKSMLWYCGSISIIWSWVRISRHIFEVFKKSANPDLGAKHLAFGNQTF